MSNQKVIDKGIKLCQLIDYARHRSRIPGARRVWPCNPTLQRPAWYGSFPPTQDWSLPMNSLTNLSRHAILLLLCLRPCGAQADTLNQFNENFWNWRAQEQPFSEDDIP